MSNNQLIVFDEFKRLIIPLPRKEQLQLENDISKNGCKEPIKVWHSIVVDGHKRFEICKKLNISFEVEEVNFDSKEAAISWICELQLQRRDIPFESRKFLIGIQYESEKAISHRRTNQEIVKQSTESDRPLNQNQVEHKTAHYIASQNFVSITTVQKYAAFARAIVAIGKKEPALVPKLLSGDYRFSHNQVLGFSQKAAEELKRFNKLLEKDPAPYMYHKYLRNDHPAEKDEFGNEPQKYVPSVKDMPEYDPDAEINSLTLTIPTWRSSIERTKSHANLSAITKEARERVLTALYELRLTISDMIITLREEI